MKQFRFFSFLLVALFVASVAQAQPRAKVTTKEFVAISYNVRMSLNPEADGSNFWDYRREASLKMVAEQQPLVMGLQEACPDQIAYFDRNLTGYKHVGVGRDDGKAEGEMMAIYYDTRRLTLLRSGTFWLSATPDVVSRGWDAACNRTCTWALLKLKNSNQAFFYFNTHLDHIGREARKQSIELIVKKIAEINPQGVPVLLSADFNSTTDNAIFNPLKAALGDARADSPVTDHGITYNGFGKVKGNPATNNDNAQVIDHIFYKGVTPIGFKVLTGDYGVPYISDHYPIAFTFGISITSFARTGNAHLLHSPDSTTLPCGRKCRGCASSKSGQSCKSSGCKTGRRCAK